MTKIQSVVSRIANQAVAPQRRAVGQSSSFAEALQQEESLKFSRHAQERMEERSILLSEGERSRLEAGVGQAAAKGARETLVMVNDRAFIVSVVNRTVVTAMDAAQGKERLVTDIDSVIVV